MEKGEEVKKILFGDSPREIRTLFCFDRETSTEKVVLKFNLFSRFFFAKFFSHKDAPFHKEIDLYNVRTYRGEIDSFLNIVFRGGSKTTRTKLFIVFAVLNDLDHGRRYIKILSKDAKNSTQFVTDIYNMLVQSRINVLYPEVFSKTVTKREETMSSFTTSQGVKVTAGTVGTSQRGNIQDDARPDLIIFDDFEDRTTLRSAVLTQAIFDNCEEARTGLAKRGACIYLGNYISERGNIHKLVQKIQNKLIVPIIKDGEPTWEAYTVGEIKTIEDNAEDFAGEYLCEPSAGADVFFDRTCLDLIPKKEPIREVAGFRIYYPYDPSHRYGSGHDVAGGVGLDSSTSAFIDFTPMPNRVVATFCSNTIKPDVFGHEIIREADMFGQPIVAVENNKFDMCLGVLKHQNYPNIYFTEMKEIRVGIPPATRTLGWNTNTMTKPKMLFELKKAVEDGHLWIPPELVAELRSYSRDDLMDRDEDVRLTTRHFDLLMSCFVKGTLVLTDKGQTPIELLKVGDFVLTRKGFKKIIATNNRLATVIKNIGLVGTADHPIICNNEDIKDLQSVSIGDNLSIWNPQTKTIEKKSYTEAHAILDILMQNRDNTACTTWEEQNGKNQGHTFIGRFGLIRMEKYQRVIRYITRTATHLITRLQTLNYCLRQNTCDATCRNLIENPNLEKPLVETETKSIKVSENLLNTEKKENSNVFFVEYFLKPPLTMVSIVLGLVRRKYRGISVKNRASQTNVSFVLNNSSHIYRIKKDAQAIATTSKEENIQRVYNIEVADQPEYFANGILVHNCAIAWQMRNFATVKREVESNYQQEAYQRAGLDE